jgi:Initiator Replication protein
MAEIPKMRDIQAFDDPDLIVLRNPVAKARFHLSVYQTKFLLEVLSHLKSKPEDRILSFDIRQFNRSLNLDNNDIKYYVNEVRKMVRHVVSIPVEERKDGGIRLKEVALIAAIDTDIDGKGEGSIKVEVADMIKPYFLEIANGQFFSFHKYNSRVLKGRYSISLYMLLKSYQRFRTLQINYEELRDILEIKPEEYRPFKEFKRWVLEKSRKEMMEKNDIYFDYEVVRATYSKKSDVEKVVFHIINNPNHAAIFKEFQQKEGKIKKPHFVKGEVSEGKTGEISELKTVEFYDQLNTHLKADNSFATSIDKEIIHLFKEFEPNMADSLVINFIEGIISKGYSEERVLDVMLYAQERKQKGEKIRNIQGYLLRGLTSETMGLGLAKIKEKQGRVVAENDKWKDQINGIEFKEWLNNFYINKGIDADNEVKIAFAEASKKLKAMSNYFDEEGRVKESEKDKFRMSLGKKLVNTEGVTTDMLFVQWVLVIHGKRIVKEKDRWVEK